MRLASELVSSLGDKYTRILDKESYSALQRFDIVGVGTPLITKNKKIVVAAPPVKISSATRAGLEPGDVVAAVNGVSTEGKYPLERRRSIVKLKNIYICLHIVFYVFHPRSVYCITIRT